MSRISDGFMKFAFGIGVLAAGVGVGYRYGVYLPRVEAEAAARIATEKKHRQEEYKSCKWTAFSSYAGDHIKECRKREQGMDCELPSQLESQMSRDFDDAQKRCLDEARMNQGGVTWRANL